MIANQALFYKVKKIWRNYFIPGQHGFPERHRRLPRPLPRVLLLGERPGGGEGGKQALQWFGGLDKETLRERRRARGSGHGGIVQVVFSFVTKKKNEMQVYFFLAEGRSLLAAAPPSPLMPDSVRVNI